jgi:tripeptidyl-peptidase-2
LHWVCQFNSRAGDVRLQNAETTKETIDGNEFLTIKSFSGRTLILDSNLINPTGNFKIGIKNTVELFPEDLKNRIESERKVEFLTKHHALVTKNSTTSTEKIDQKQAKIKQTLLDEFLKEYKDPGQSIDCVCYHDGKDWRALIDVKGSGDLRGVKPMTDYKKEFHYSNFGVASMLNYSINFYDDGKVLSIVTNAGMHGTHVFFNLFRLLELLLLIFLMNLRSMGLLLVVRSFL